MTKVKIKVQVRTPIEIEITLPFYSLVEKNGYLNYYEIEEDIISSDKNKYLSIKDGKIHAYREFAQLADAVEGVQISKDDFYHALTKIIKGLHDKYFGEYYSEPVSDKVDN